MERRWEKLREDHLEPLLAIFEEANKDVPMQVITLESTPVGGEGPRIYPSARQSLRDIRFNPTGDSKLTIDKVERAAELLGSFKYRGQTVDSHLVVVAATDPSPEVPAGIKQYPWFLAAKKLASYGPLCHLSLVKDGQDISPFVNMFQNALWLQKCSEVMPPFDYDGATFVFHFCSKAQSQVDRPLSGQATPEISESRRTEKSRQYAGGGFLDFPDDRYTETSALDPAVHGLTHYDSTSSRASQSGPTSFPPPSTGVRSEAGRSVSRAASRIDIARLVEGSIQLPSVPELSNFGLSPYTVDPSASASRLSPSSSNLPHLQAARDPPPSGRRSSFIDDIFSPNSRRDSHSDLDDDTEAFWMEGRALEEALMRYGKDGANLK